MFSGVTEGMGKVVLVSRVAAAKGKGLFQVRLGIEAPAALTKQLRHGSSVAVNGVCLSAVALRGRRLFFDAVEETLHRTSLGRLRPGDRVNLERPLKYGERIEGHFVLGHIDGAGRIERVLTHKSQKSFLIRFPASLRPFLFEKGSVALDGISLTIGRIQKNTFWVHCIPVTLQKTTFGMRRPGDDVNIEADWLVKSLKSKRSRSKHGRKPGNRLK